MRNYWVNFGLVIVIALGARLYKINNPVLDWHAFRQADTASVTREYVLHGIDIWRPHYLDLSNIQSGKDNLAGYRMVEFPILNVVTAALLRTLPVLPEAATGRTVAAIFSLCAIVGLMLLVKAVWNQSLSLLSGLVMAIMPYSIYYSRTILPEPVMLAFSLLSLWSFVRWLQTSRWTWYLLTAGLLALAMLTKPFVAFTAPLYLALALTIQPRTFFRPWLWLLAVAAFGPFMAWRNWILQFPSGIPANDWLWNGDGIRLRPAWFRWLFWERLTKLILGWAGILPLCLAVTQVLLIKNRQTTIVLSAWAAGLLAYLVLVATGNVRHDYYQVLLIPALAVGFAMGLQQLHSMIKLRFGLRLSLIAIFLVCAVSWYLSWQQIGDYYHTNHPEYLTAGAAVDQLVPQNALVIAPAFGDTQFLFQTRRRGWPIGFEIEDKIKKGATHYVNTSYDDEARQLENRYRTVRKTPEYIILDLTKPRN